MVEFSPLSSSLLGLDMLDGFVNVPVSHFASAEFENTEDEVEEEGTATVASDGNEDEENSDSEEWSLGHSGASESSEDQQMQYSAISCVSSVSTIANASENSLAETTNGVQEGSASAGGITILSSAPSEDTPNVPIMLPPFHPFYRAPDDREDSDETQSYSTAISVSSFSLTTNESVYASCGNISTSNGLAGGSSNGLVSSQNTGASSALSLNPASLSSDVIVSLPESLLTTQSDGENRVISIPNGLHNLVVPSSLAISLGAAAAASATGPSAVGGSGPRRGVQSETQNTRSGNSDSPPKPSNPLRKSRRLGVITPLFNG